MGNRGDLHRAADSGQRARKGENADGQPRDWNAEERRRAPVAAHRAYLEPDAGLEQEQVASNCQRDGDTYAEIQPGRWKEGVHPRAVRDRRARGIRARRLDQRTVYSPAKQLRGDEVHHDGADDLVDVAPRAEPSANSAPYRPAGSARDQQIRIA